jgi:opacity protein-like surface antigen
MNTKSVLVPGIRLAWLLVASAVTQYPANAQQPPPGYPQPPAPQYNQPPPGYPQPPPPQYNQPPPGYPQPPPPQYNQPPPQYTQPPPQYTQPPPPPAQSAPPPYTQPPPQQGYPPPAYAPPPAYPPPPGYTQPSRASTKVPEGIQYHPFRMQIHGGYTITEGTVKDTLHDGGNYGIGFTWFPSRSMPIGLRVDVGNNTFNQSLASLSQASAATGTNVVDGYTDLYGGDADLELDLTMGSKVREYFFGGVGWYRQHTVFKSATLEQGLICFFYCTPGYVPVYYTSAESTSDWMRGWNAGVGFEFALRDPATVFIEARYLRITQGQPPNSNTSFVPIRIGLRF